MTVNVYRSTDASAPVLSGLPGALVAIFDACLVNGYGAKAAAGWAKEFSAPNIAVYRSAFGNRLRLRIDDTAAQEARVVGYESMTDASTGVGAFPMSSQVSGGLYVRKSESADAVTRNWVLIATDRTLYFLPSSSGNIDPQVAPAASSLSGSLAFGQITTYKPGDAFNTIIMGAAATGQSQGVFGINTRTSGFSGASGHYLARNHLQFGNATLFQKTPILDCTGTTSIFGLSSNYPPFPDSMAGGLNLSPVAIGEFAHGSSLIIRGLLPGVWAPLHNTPMSHYDIVDGQGDLAGKQFQMLFTASATLVSRLLFEISDTW